MKFNIRDWLCISEMSRKGKWEELHYFTDNQFHRGLKVEKKAYVFVPFNYENRGKEKFDVVYFMHGAGTDLDRLVERENWNFLDCLTPRIYVFPTYYQGEYTSKNCTKEKDMYMLEYFPKELVRDLIPAVESKYAVHRDRDHRSFAGFSAGAVITWNVFAECLREFKYFIPLCGDCWKLGLQGGKHKSKETAEYLNRRVKEQGVAVNDFVIYAAVGQDDVSYVGECLQVMDMRRKDVFYDENLKFGVCEKGTHDYFCAWFYFWNILRQYF